MDPAGWQPRFEELTRRHRVPGASLAVLADDEVTTLAAYLHDGARATPGRASNTSGDPTLRALA